MSYQIREAKESDYQTVNHLAYELYSLHYQNRPDIFNDTNLCFSKEAFLKELDDENSNILVIVDQDKHIIGYACFQIVNKKKTLLKCSRNYLYVDDIVIKKSHQHKGLGTLLHKKIVAYAKSTNCSSIELEVFDFNKQAISFYEKLGFTFKTHSLEFIIDERRDNCDSN